MLIRISTALNKQGINVLMSISSAASQRSKNISEWLASSIISSGRRGVTARQPDEMMDRQTDIRVRRKEVE